MRHYWRCMLHFIHKSKNLTFMQEVEISPFLRQDPVYHWHLADNRRERAETEPFTFRSIIIEHIGSALSGEIEKVTPLRSLSRSCVIFSAAERVESFLSLSEFGGTMHDCVTPFIRSSLRPHSLSVRPFARWRTCKALITSTRRSLPPSRVSRCWFRQSPRSVSFSLYGYPSAEEMDKLAGHFTFYASQFNINSS